MTSLSPRSIAVLRQGGTLLCALLLAAAAWAGALVERPTLTADYKPIFTEYGRCPEGPMKREGYINHEPFNRQGDANLVVYYAVQAAGADEPLGWFYWDGAYALLPGVPANRIILTLPGAPPEQVTVEEFKARFHGYACDLLGVKSA